jgi:colanic acid/amylovoran/stewartan biosynthesis glycosyltransferase WcaL/AmsK/CpsK
MYSHGVQPELNVVQAVDVWLGLTEPWLHDSIHYLPSKIRSHVVCRRLANLEYFDVPNLHSLEDVHKFRLGCDMVLRKLRMRRSWGLLTDELRKCNAQILHSHFGNMGWQNIDAAASKGVPHIVSFYGHDVDRLPKINSRWIGRYEELFSAVDKVLCLGPHMKSRLKERGCPENKLIVHNLGVRVSEIPFYVRTWQSGEPFRVLIAASFREKKGIPYAIEALGRLNREVSLEITIIGGASNEQRSMDEEKKILACIRKFDLEFKVKLLGYQSHEVLLEEAYKHHVFLSPSITASDGDTEGTPVTLMEMAATGIPIVSTRHSDIPHIIVDRQTGFLADERDVDGLLRCIYETINNYKRPPEILLSGRQNIEKNFNASSQSLQLADLYRSVSS